MGGPTVQVNRGFSVRLHFPRVGFLARRPLGVAGVPLGGFKEAEVSAVGEVLPGVVPEVTVEIMDKSRFVFQGAMLYVARVS